MGRPSEAVSSSIVSAAMVKRGLKIVPVDVAARKAWQEMAERGYAQIRGSVVPEKYFDETLRLRNEYRALQLANKVKPLVRKDES